MTTKLLLLIAGLVLMSGCSIHDRIDGNRSSWIYYGDYDIVEPMEKSDGILSEKFGEESEKAPSGPLTPNPEDTLKDDLNKAKDDALQDAKDAVKDAVHDAMPWN